jgi:hypothetical protein
LHGRAGGSGTDDIEEAILEPLMTEEQARPRPPPDTKLPEEREVEAASSRGDRFSH